MAKPINKYAENVMLRSINRLINKYGHDVVLRQNRDGEVTGFTNSKAIFGSFKVSFGGGTLIINNNYKIRIRADAFPFPIIPLDKVEINGVELTVITGRKISPDGASTIVWEVEAAGGAIPVDGNSADTPTVTSPANNTSNYPTVAEDAGVYAGSFTASTYSVATGESAYVSSDWQISPDSAFAFIQNEAYAVGTTWVSDTVLSNPLNYYVRVRHNGTNGVVTPWSAGNLFSFGTITEAPVEDITTPTLVTPGGYLTANDTYYSEYSDATGGFLYKAAPRLSAFASGTGKVFDHVHWQIGTDTSFTTIIYEGDSAGGYDFQTSNVFDYNQLLMPYRGYSYGEWVIRGKYVSTDATESAYCTPVGYFMD